MFTSFKESKKDATVAVQVGGSASFVSRSGSGFDFPLSAPDPDPASSYTSVFKSGFYFTSIHSNALCFIFLISDVIFSILDRIFNFSLSVHLVEMDTDPDSAPDPDLDSQALGADPNPNPDSAK